MCRLTQIANETGTDKGTVVGNAHAYTIVYEALLASQRNLPINLMEIGLAMRGQVFGFLATRIVEDVPSIKMWHEYFPRGNIYGVDISDCSRFQTDRFHFYQADCGDAERLGTIAKQLSDSGTKFDVIIDDGSHASYHQQMTFLKFFSLVKPGGLYIIEDLDWIPIRLEHSLPAVPRTRELLRQILRYGRVVSGGAFSSTCWDVALAEIGGILTFDGAYLEDLRRRFNFSSKPSENRVVDRERSSTFLRILSRLRSTLRAVAGEPLSAHVVRSKLAVIQKRT